MKEFPSKTNMTTKAKPTSWEKKHYQKLVGIKIVGIEFESFEGQTMAILVLDKKDSAGANHYAAVQCDPEGNGPGHLHLSW